MADRSPDPACGRAAHALQGLQLLVSAARMGLADPDAAETVTAIGGLRDRVHGIALCGRSLSRRLNTAAWPMLQQAAERTVAARGESRDGWRQVTTALLGIASADLEKLQGGADDGA